MDQFGRARGRQLRTGLFEMTRDIVFLRSQRTLEFAQ
ncbi:hypothetical protein LINPERPRIM_LOCUS914 [Linum perenne]